MNRDSKSMVDIRDFQFGCGAPPVRSTSLHRSKYPSAPLAHQRTDSPLGQYLGLMWWSSVWYRLLVSCLAYWLTVLSISPVLLSTLPVIVHYLLESISRSLCSGSIPIISTSSGFMNRDSETMGDAQDFEPDCTRFECPIVRQYAAADTAVQFTNKFSCVATSLFPST